MNWPMILVAIVLAMGADATLHSDAVASESTSTIDTDYAMQDLEELETSYFEKKEALEENVKEDSSERKSINDKSSDADTKVNGPSMDIPSMVDQVSDDLLGLNDDEDDEDEFMPLQESDDKAQTSDEAEVDTKVTDVAVRDAEAEKVLTMIIEKEDSDVVAITDKLEEKGLTIKKLFAARSGRGLAYRCLLPGIKEWVADKIKLDYAMNIKTAFLLLGKVGDLLRVSYAGCKGYSCQASVTKVHSRYQNLIYSSARVSSRFVRYAVTAVRYHYYAAKRLDKFQTTKAFKWITRTAMISQRMITRSKRMVFEAGVLTNLSENALIATVSDDKTNKQQIDRFIERMKNMTANADKLNAILREKKKEEETANQAIANALKNQRTWEEKHTDEANRALKINQKCTPAKCDFDIGFLKIGYKAKSCVTEVDKTDANLKKTKLNDYENEIKKARDEYLKVLMMKQEIQRKNAELYGDLAETLSLKNSGKAVKSDLDNAQKSLEIAIKVLTMVKTIFLEALDFWKKLTDHAKSLGAKGTDMTALKDLGMGDDFEFKEIMIGSGFNWLAFGKVAKEAADAMREVKGEINEGFTNLPTHDQAKKLVETSGPLIAKVQEMIRDLRSDQTATNEQIAEAEAAVKKEKEIEGVLEEDKTTAAPSVTGKAIVKPTTEDMLLKLPDK